MSKKIILSVVAVAALGAGGYCLYEHQANAKNAELVEAELKDKLDSSAVPNVMSVSYGDINSSGGITTAHDIALDFNGYKVTVPAMEVHEFDTAHPETPYYMTVKVPQFKLPLGEELEKKIGEAKADNPAVALLTKNFSTGINGSYESAYKFNAEGKTVFTSATISFNNIAKLKFDANFGGIEEALFLAQMGGVESLEKYVTEKGGMLSILGSVTLDSFSLELTDNGAKDLFLMGAASEKNLTVDQIKEQAGAKFEMLAAQAQTDKEKKIAQELKKFVEGSKGIKFSLKPENGALMGVFMQLQANPRGAIETLNLDVSAM